MDFYAKSVVSRFFDRLAVTSIWLAELDNICCFAKFAVSRAKSVSDILPNANSVLTDDALKLLIVA